MTGKWRESEDAAELLKLDAEDDEDDEAEVFGDFEDLETGEKTEVGLLIYQYCKIKKEVLNSGQFFKDMIVQLCSSCLQFWLFCPIHGMNPHIKNKEKKLNMQY